MKQLLSTSQSSSLANTQQRLICARLLLETGLLFVTFALLANHFGPESNRSVLSLAVYVSILFAQGLVLQRIYMIAHEAAHKKLDPLLWVNDGMGQAVLVSIFVPLQIYRKIHQFHHGFNRKDISTSALDVFVSPWPITPLIKIICFCLWYLGVFAGGLFFHSLVSIVLFLCMPVRLARKISPAFRRWSNRDRLVAWVQFLSAVAIHVGFSQFLGFSAWVFTFGLPIVSFAWIWSLMVYIFHYNTTLGDYIRYNVRSINSGRFIRWWLMNFNQHATHHMYPNIPWYELPSKAQELPKAFAEKNQNVKSIWQAVLNQFKGPIVVYKQDSNPVPQLFIHWED